MEGLANAEGIRRGLRSKNSVQRSRACISFRLYIAHCCMGLTYELVCCIVHHWCPDSVAPEDFSDQISGSGYLLLFVFDWHLHLFSVQQASRHFRRK